MTAQFTNAGITLLATALQTPGVNAAVTYVAIGTGVGTLASGLTSGNTYTSLPLAAPLPTTLAAGQALTLLDASGHTQALTASGAGNTAGVTSITVNSFTANASYAAGSALSTTPAATDTALYNESARVAALTGIPGGVAGESLLSAYFDPTTASGAYIEVGYYGGSTATATSGTGTLIARDLQFWNHTQNADSASPALDCTISLT